MRGRKQTPTILKLIAGNPGRRPINGREPKPPCTLPSCPSHLSPKAQTEWKRLALSLNEIGVLAEIDRAAMAAYCQAYGRWVEAEKKLREAPTLLKTRAGYLQPSPWLTIANKQLEIMARFRPKSG